MEPPALPPDDRTQQFLNMDRLDLPAKDRIRVRHQYPLPLHHSWPLFEQGHHFDLGWVDRQSIRPPGRTPATDYDDAAAVMERHGVGSWTCDLADDHLVWSDTVYDIFGLPRGVEVARSDAVALYREESRAAMERLRAYAITHRRGFTLDVAIEASRRKPRWVRLIAAPVCEDDRVVALNGFKYLIGA